MKSDVAALLMVLFLGFSAIPFVPHESFMILDNAMIRIILLLIMVYSLRYGPIIGVASFMLVAALLLERNYRILSYSGLYMRMKRRGAAPRDGPERDMPESPAIYYVDDEVPSESDMQYGPQDETGVNDFEPVAPSENKKVVLPAVPLGSVGAALFN